MDCLEYILYKYIKLYFVLMFLKKFFKKRITFFICNIFLVLLWRTSQVVGGHRRERTKVEYTYHYLFHNKPVPMTEVAIE